VSFKLETRNIFQIFISIFFALITEIHLPKLYQKKFKYVFSSYIKFTFLVVFFYFIIDLIWGIVSPGLYLIISISILLVNGVLILILLSKEKHKEQKNEVKKYEQGLLKLDDNLMLGKLKDNIGIKLNYCNENVLTEIDKTLNMSGICEVGIIDYKNDLKDRKYDIIILDFPINNVSNINLKFTEIYSKLKNGGMFLLCYEDLEDYENKIYITKNRFIKKIKLFHYYLCERLLPKLPYLKNILKFINKYIVLSKAEVWGRLAYNGFDVTNEFKVGNLTFIISQKLLEPSKNPNPSFYPLIRLNRVGLNGRL
jgi:uncharacterized membrane protein